MLHKGARLRNKRFFLFLSVCLSFLLLLLLLLLFCVLRRVGQCSGNTSGVNHVLEKKNETYALKWERFFYSRFTKTQVELPVYLTFASAWLQNVPAELRMQCAARRMRRTFTHGKWSVRLLHHVSSLSLKSFKTDSILPSADQANKILNYTLNESALIALWRGHFFGRE